MFEAANTAERRGQMLARVAELGLSLAEDLHARALAAETAQDAQAMALAFHRITRSLRQTIALEAKLERDLVLAEREAVKTVQANAERRKLQLRLAVEREIWNEAEGAEAERLIDELGDLIDEESLGEDFGAEPFAVHIARLRADLGLPAPGAIESEAVEPRPETEPEPGALTFDAAARHAALDTT